VRGAASTPGARARKIGSRCCTISAPPAATIGRGFDLQAKRIGRGDAGRRRWLSLARQHGQNHVAAGDAGLQGFGTGCLDRDQAMVEHRAQHLDEMTITVGVAFQLGRTWAKAGGRSQSLKGAPLRNAPGFFTRTGR
jgi:hypothetical protein